MFEFVRNKINKYNKIIELELRLKSFGVTDEEIKQMKEKAKNYPCRLENFLEFEIEKVKTNRKIPIENLYNAINMQQHLEREFSKIGCTSTKEQTELNIEDIIQLYKNLRTEKLIYEILVTNLVKTEQMQILHNKYLCMNADTYEVLKEALRQDCFDTNDLLKKLYLVPVFTGDLADRKYKECFIKGLNLGFHNIKFTGGLEP